MQGALAKGEAMRAIQRTRAAEAKAKAVAMDVPASCDTEVAQKPATCGRSASRGRGHGRGRRGGRGASRTDVEGARTLSPPAQ